MPSQEISSLPLAGTLTGDELVHIVQGGNSRGAPIEAIADAIAGTVPARFRGFRSTTSVGQSISATTLTEVIFGTEVFDTEAAFASNRFTVPAALNGKYAIFNSGILFDGDELFDLFIERSSNGGTSWSAICQSSNSVDESATVASGPVLLTTGHIYRTTVFTSLPSFIVDDDRVFFSAAVLESSDNGIQIVTEASGTRVLANADFIGTRILMMDNSSAQTVTINTGLIGTQPLTVIQKGTGQITYGGTATLNSKGGNRRSNGRHSAVTIIPEGSNVYTLIGDLVA
jgi:hypothetical protein